MKVYAKFFSIAVTVALMMPGSAMAQHSAKKHHTTKHTKHIATNAPIPTWAASHQYDAKEHVYFPDYYTFYDANRGGYVFWKNGQWTFTPAMPPYMQSADMNKARVQILKGVSLDLHPEVNYPRYMKLYPATPGGAGENVPTPVPIPGAQ